MYTCTHGGKHHSQYHIIITVRMYLGIPAVPYPDTINDQVSLLLWLGLASGALSPFFLNSSSLLTWLQVISAVAALVLSAGLLSQAKLNNL